MENNELHQILFQLDTDRGRTTKLKILKLLGKRKANVNEICSLLKIKSYSHANKFLNFLYDIFLVDYNEVSFSNDYKSYVKREWFLTDLGKELIESLKDVSLLKKLTPKMFLEKLKRDIRSCEQYKNWRQECLKKGNKKCKICEVEGDSIQVHHKIELNLIMKNNNIDSLEKALQCKELFDVENGECLCTLHHYDKHGAK